MHVLIVVLLLLSGCSQKMKDPRAMEWDDPLNPIVLASEAVAAKQKPVLLVMHEDDRHVGWQFLDGGDVTGQKPRVILKDDLLKLDPSLRDVTDLPVGWEARRETASSAWTRRRL